MRRTIAILSVLTAWSLETGPPDYPTDYFRSPLGIPLSLSGNFAEMRSNHFHTGLDIRTNAQTGYRVYAAAEGWISRIAVSPGGYGHALYLQHPNGFTTVYAHLDRFEEPLASFVKESQYARQSFGVNLFPDAGQFPFAKGDVIGYSGNSGSSGGPHLHFEIRDSATSEPLNPLLFGLPVEDETPPRIYRVKVYVSDPTGSAAFVSASGDTMAVARPGRPAEASAVAGGDGYYRLERNAHLVADGRIGFGIQAHDYHDRSQSRLGLFTTTLRAGEVDVFHARMERLNFSNQRYINAHLDFAERALNRRWVQRSHLLPGNRLPLYETVRRGYLDVRPGDSLPVSYSLSDVYGNQASLSFDVQGAALMDPAPPSTQGYLLSHDRADSFVMPGIIVRFPRGALYDDLELDFSQSAGPAGTFSPRYNLHRATTPIHSPIAISLDASGLPERLRHKALLARIDSGSLVSAGGGYENGYITSQTRTFGSFVIAADTVAPRIEAVNISDGVNLRRAASIRFRIRDELSGIASYIGQIDGRWALFEYDPKRTSLYHTFDGRVSSGRHEVTLRVEDGKGNVSRYSATFVR